uniref:THUMP domain-containing protein 3-like n=1 Tax=Ciona intestinalis TaxID=7719 RepID=UPI000180B12B|nr:THUMP domain-containing protein 3-like [Ciona intestinalis]|eukprot:XP_002126201.1 THUMP domain-containing protein 3-like [Ciona intestinalis]
MKILDMEKFGGEVTIGATVATGFEFTAVDEITKKIDVVDYDITQGKVFFTATSECFAKIHQLRSVDKLFLVVKRYENYVYDVTKEVELERIGSVAFELPWEQVEKYWNENRPFCIKMNKFQKQKLRERKKKRRQLNLDGCGGGDEEDSDLEVWEKSTDVNFRVTCNRVGKKQSVTSPEAEYKFGGNVQDATGWNVNLSCYNLEVLLEIGLDSLMVALSLTPFSLHHRNIEYFGRTTLRSTIAYNMLMLCKLKVGEVVVDPMCGTGSIPLEGAMEWKGCLHVGGDNSGAAMERVSGNVGVNNGGLGVNLEKGDNLGVSQVKRDSFEVNENGNRNLEINTEKISEEKLKYPVEVIRWDATRLPWRDSTIDVCVTDLPFGKRMGSQHDNRVLYPRFLHELARVSKVGTSRACLLTYDRRSALNAFSKLNKLWSLKRTVNVNIGGLRAAVYLLGRTKHKFVVGEDFNLEEKKKKFQKNETKNKKISEEFKKLDISI